jgi:hypothetical protein
MNGNVLTPKSLIEMATRIVVVRVWQTWNQPELEHGTQIQLVTISTDHDKRLIHAHYGISVPYRAVDNFPGYKRGFGFQEYDSQWEKEAKKIIDSWKNISPQLCEDKPALALDIEDSYVDGCHVIEVPLNRIDFLLNYAKFETNLFDANHSEKLDTLINRFNAFCKDNIIGLRGLAEIVKMPF